jgi:DNA-directed RNA polymerase specialized sigma24 family protein
MAANGAGSVAKELEGVRAGSESATGRLVHRYWGRLQWLVHGRVRWYGRPAVSVDQEDVANAALNSVIVHLRRGKYPDLVDHDGLWRLLARFATRKAGRLVRRWQRQPAVRPISTSTDPADSSRTPSARVASAEDLERLMNALRAYQPPRSQHPQGEELVQLVSLFADGHDFSEIADRLGVARCTAYRWLGLVRRIGAEQGIVIQIDESAQ